MVKQTQKPVLLVQDNLSKLTENELKQTFKMIKVLLEEHNRANNKEALMRARASEKAMRSAAVSECWKQYRSLTMDSESSQSGPGRKRYKFWDRSLSLDWGEPGVPKVQYPVGRPKPPSPKVNGHSSPIGSPMNGAMNGAMNGRRSPKKGEKVDWQIMRMLSEKLDADDDYGVDWDVMKMMGTPKERTLNDKFVDEDDFVEPLIVDWSRNFLPQADGTTGPIKRRKGPHASRTRIGINHKLNQNRCRHQAGTVAVLDPEAHVQGMVEAKMRRNLMPKEKAAPTVYTFAPPRRLERGLHQPGGGRGQPRASRR